MATALLVIDFQYGLIESTPPATRGAQTLAQINAMIALARQRQMPVIFIQHHEADLPQGSPAWELHPGLARLADDHVIAKESADSFLATQLQSTLNALNIDALWITGYASDFCVDTTLRRAASLGYMVTVVSDAHTSKDRPHANGEQLVAHLNWLWANLAVKDNPIRVLPLAELATV
ncbi:isochorismatase family protein [Chitinibacter fontanus]|uniref:Isochorismatase family protein n=1 Tax=Chitinibacter fontanus TaxID=1737446 RepID=A0A7D5Z8Z8_9NEIS|nr:isochorismatase family protein [Chitinibacter fontanus]QLI80625.1 isochorismatase family protein [Chitinibacter fontanus]